MKTTLCFVLTAVLFVFSSSPLQAQTHAAPATLSGALTDSSGAGVAGAKITAETLDSPAPETYRTVSGSDGGYTMTLPAGRVRLRITHVSFASREFALALATGEAKKLDVRLEIERLASSVVVTAQAEPLDAERSPAPATILSRTDLVQRQAAVLTDLLLFTPGVSLGRTGAEGGQASIFLSGGNSSFTKVLVDGTPVNEPGNAVDFSNFTLDNIDKVEIVRGAESALYGTDAVSGVIQVFTHRGTTRTPEMTLFAEGGGFSTGRGGAQLSGLLGRFDYSAAAAYFGTAGQGPNNDFLNRTLSGNFGWRFSDTQQVRISLRNNTSDAGIPGQTLLLPPNLDQRNALHFSSANARWEFSTGSHWRHQIMGAESYNREHATNLAADFFDPGDPFCAPLAPNAVPSFTCDFTYDSTNKYNRASLNAQSSYLLPQGGVTAGYQYEVENANLSALGGGHVRRNNQGGFLDARWLPLTRLTVSAGLRAEANESFGTRVVPRIGALLVPRFGNGFWGDTRVHVFYGQGIKEPRLDQSFGTDVCFPGNPSLHPERSRTWNVGVDQKLASDRVKVSGEYFQNRFYNIVSFTFCVPGGPCPIAPPPGCGFGFGTFFNTDLARARGTNVELEARPARWLTIAASYTYNDTRVLQAPNAFDPALATGNRLIRRPPHSGSIVLNAAFRRMNWNFAGYFTGARTDSDFLGLGLNRNPGYARFDLAASYDLGRGVSLYGRATNLFDKDYQDALGYPSLGRDFRLGMRYTLRGKD